MNVLKLNVSALFCSFIVHLEIVIMSVYCYERVSRNNFSGNIYLYIKEVVAPSLRWLQRGLVDLKL